MTLLGALLFAAALPNELFPLGSPLLGLVALVPYYLALCRTADARSAARLGALFGAVSTIIANYWLMFFEDYSAWTIGGTTLAYIVFNYLLAGFLWRATRAPRVFRPVLFALVWTFYEYLKSVGFLGYPWGLAAYPFNQLHAFNQLVQITGVWGLSFIAVYLNATLAEWVLLPRGTARALASRNTVVVVLLVASVGVYGAYRLNTPVEVKDTVDLVLVQQNADAWNTRDISRPLLTSQRETEVALEEFDQRPELIVWSETSLRYFYVEGRNWYVRNPSEQPFIDFLASLPAPLLTGAPYQDPSDHRSVYNAVLQINQDSDVAAWYGKQHLVPFAEVIPFWDVPAVQRLFRDVIGIPGAWTPGPGNRLFEIRGNDGAPVRIATPICFEDGFSYINRRFVHSGADLLINLTNNSWSRTNSAQLQHFVAARYRAIETRRGLIRSTNSGYTAVIDPWGRVVEAAPMFVTAHLNVTVPVYAPATESAYILWGDLLAQIAGAFLVSLLIVNRFRSAKQRRACIDTAFE
jgi:apolipoprotein N-acyltransferase